MICFQKKKRLYVSLSLALSLPYFLTAEIVVATFDPYINTVANLKDVVLGLSLVVFESVLVFVVSVLAGWLQFFTLVEARDHRMTFNNCCNNQDDLLNLYCDRLAAVERNSKCQPAYDTVDLKYSFKC